jgi:DNA-binding transcriptional regulator GbsR (MarR family)
MTDNAGSDQENLNEARSTVIEALVQVYSLYGLSDVLGRIYGVLFFADHPLGLEDIAGELGVSKATVSVNVRILEGVGTIRKVWRKGSRRDYYEAERDFTWMMTETIEKMMRREIEITSAAIDRSKELLIGVENSPDHQVAERARLYLQFVQNLERLYRQSDRIVAAIAEIIRGEGSS